MNGVYIFVENVQNIKEKNIDTNTIFGCELKTPKFEFSGADLLNTICAALIAAEKNLYPINVATIYEKKAGNDILDNFQQLRNWLDLNLNLLDFEIHNAEYLML
jgi:hypothetical protein